jgi:hypothetical protein
MNKHTRIRQIDKILIDKQIDSQIDRQSRKTELNNKQPRNYRYVDRI